MVTDDERREVAKRLRMNVDKGVPLLLNVAFAAFTVDPVSLERVVTSDEAALKLADLIDPNSHPNSGTQEVGTSQVPKFDPTERGIDSIYDWCFERLEGADGAEDYLYCSIMSAIEEFRHPERVMAHTARPVDREALLRLADGLCDGYPYGLSHGGLEQLARRIREACGEVAS